MRRMLDLIDFGLATPPWPEVLYICECDGDPPTSNLARLLRDFAERSPRGVIIVATFGLLPWIGRGQRAHLFPLAFLFGTWG